MTQLVPLVAAALGAVGVRIVVGLSVSRSGAKRSFEFVVDLSAT
jgi:hypothetical protein